LSGVDERDAEEIDTSASAMTATHARAPMPTFGSAWIALGAFHETIAAGTTPSRVVLGPTPTWVAAPHISEADCRRKEPNPKRFAREYGSVADSASDEAILEGYLIDRAMRAEVGDVPPEPGVSYTAAMDPSLGRNSWSFVIAGPRTLDGRQVASIVLHREWKASRGHSLDPALVLEHIAAHCRAYRVDHVLTDQFHAESLAAIADKMRLGFQVVIDKAGQAQKVARWENCAMRFLDDAVELPRDPLVKADLVAVSRRVSGNTFTIAMAVSADGRHADFAPAVALALERVAVENAAPAWIGAMQRLMSGELRPAPGPSRRPAHGPNPAYEPDALEFDPETLGRKGTGFGRDGEPKGPAIERYDAPNGNGEVHLLGASHAWPPMFEAIFAPGQPARFATQCHTYGAEKFTQWEAAVFRWRQEHGV
jgi:hypothetical protein